MMIELLFLSHILCSRISVHIFFIVLVKSVGCCCYLFLFPHSFPPFHLCFSHHSSIFPPSLPPILPPFLPPSLHPSFPPSLPPSLPPTLPPSLPPSLLPSLPPPSLPPSFLPPPLFQVAEHTLGNLFNGLKKVQAAGRQMAQYLCDDRQDFLELVFTEIKNFVIEFTATVKVSVTNGLHAWLSSGGHNSGPVVEH